MHKRFQVIWPVLVIRTEHILFHDNARPYVAFLTFGKLNELVEEVLPHLVYSLNLSQTDFHLFKNLSHLVREKQFANRASAENPLK